MSTKQSKVETVTYILPAYWACALVNADPSGMDDDEIEAMNKWLERVKPGYCTCPEGEAWFRPYNDANNIGGDVIEFTFIR